MSINSIWIMIVYYTKKALVLFYEKVILAIILWTCLMLVDVYYAQEIIITSLLTLTVLDFILWFCKAWKRKKINSKKMKFWVGKFITYWIWIIASYHIDLAIFKENVWWGIQYFICLYLALTEGISVLEHLEDMWVKFPLLKILKWKKKELENIKKLEDLFNKKF